MNIISRLVWLVCTGALLACLGCAGTKPLSTTDAILPEIDVVAVKENSEEALKLAQESKLEVQMVNTRLIEIDSRLVAMSDEVATISSARIEELENRLSLIIEAIKDLQAQVEQIRATPFAPPAAKKQGPATFSPSSAIDILKATPEYTAYQKGLKLYEAKNYKSAIAQFKEVQNQFPEGKFADNCFYWTGECYFSLEDFAPAIASYQQVITFRTSTKADDAQFKMGLAFLRMGQKTSAKTEFSKLMDRFPASEFVPEARKMLGEIK